MKKHSNSLKQSEAPAKRRKLGVIVERKPQEVMAELVAKLAEQLDVEIVPAVEGKKDGRDAVRPNLDRLTVGVDLGDQWSNYCILGLAGETLAEGQFRTRKQEVAEFFQVLAMSRVVIEVGTHSAWVREIIAGFGHEVLVANPRLMEGSKRRRRKSDRIDAEKLARLGRMDPKSLHPIQHRSTEVREDLVVLRSRDLSKRRRRKSDRIDAEKLARLGRMDPKSLHPIQHRSTEVREDLVVLRARDALVKSRTELINSVRGQVKSMGGRVTGCSSVAFSQKAAAEIPEEVHETLQPLLRLIATLSEEITTFDQRIEKLAAEKYMHTQLLRQVSGVGPVTALAYVLTLETPLRFARSRDVGPYLGLVPKQEDSGDIQPQLGISKAGDRMLRRLLVGSAHY